MKQIVEKANNLVKEFQIITDSLAEYNPGRRCKDKIPLDVIQYDLASLVRELDGLHAEVGKLIKNETILNEDL